MRTKDLRRGKGCRTRYKGSVGDVLRRDGFGLRYVETGIVREMDSYKKGKVEDDYP